MYIIIRTIFYRNIKKMLEFYPKIGFLLLKFYIRITNYHFYIVDLPLLYPFKLFIKII